MLPIIVIFLGAFLAFLVQPLVGNTLLPVFGGSASVWSACLASFQILLVAGYFYAHKTAKVLQSRGGSAWVHIALLVFSAGWTYFVARHHGAILSWVDLSTAPALGSVIAVLVLVVAPYVLLSSNSSLVQDISGGRYGLYAISNLGSFCGLLAYPFLFELKLSLTDQWLVFAALLLAYAVLFALLLLRSPHAPRQSTIADTGDRQPSADHQPPCAAYFTLSFASCYLLNAVSVHLGSDITPLPMIWVVLLSLYLLSYIIAFTGRGAALARFGAVAVVPLFAFAFLRYGQIMVKEGFMAELVTASLVLFVGGWVIHSRLYRTRPAAEHLTKYYLMIALGGAAGGAVCSFLMPVVSTTTAEYPIAIVLVLAVVCLDVRDEVTRRVSLAPEALARAKTVVLAVLALVAIVGVLRGYSSKDKVLYRYRNFYGIGSVVNTWNGFDNGDGYFVNELMSGGTAHGFQKVEGEWKGQMPTAYYTENAGGLAITSHPKYKAGQPLRVGICGMGAGTMATYARKGDFYRFFEINPAVERIARDERFFTFLSKSFGEVDVVVDDARRALEKEDVANEPKYDVLVVDVFSGDAIPVHMATKEAILLYLSRLQPDGILAFHISSWHTDLKPLAKAIAKECSLHEMTYESAATEYGYAALWALFTRSPLDVKFDRKLNVKVDLAPDRDLPLMTDERHSIVPYLAPDLMFRK